MTGQEVFVPWIYILIVIHIAAFWVIYLTWLRPKDHSIPPAEGKSIPFEKEAWEWVPISLLVVLGAIWFKPYHRYLTESATLFTMVSMYLISIQKETGYITITDRAMVLGEEKGQIMFKRMLHIKIATDHVEIWSKSGIQHYHEFTKREFKENWNHFKKELLLATQDKDWITITSTIKSPESAAQLPRSSPLPESETHTDI